jgi:hypothetical protein
MKWIDIKNKLPITDSEFLIVTELNNKKYIRILLFDVDEQEWKEYDNEYEDYVCVGYVTHWQHLPDLPK